ncbi:MAG: patatin-like phospholipase family protein [Oleiphilaceae bacterium]|nr:patatin-like phospholipase family protein [Oleiphilaceae bacterium]
MVFSIIKKGGSQRRALKEALQQARSYEEWLSSARALDEAEGLMAWRESPGTSLLHENLIREHMMAMRQCREQGDAPGLNRVLQESLYRHLGELSNPELYGVARSGTKFLVEAYLDEVELSMGFICDQPMPGVSDRRKLAMFREAERVFGQPALLLSGGAAFGIYHMGVTRALWQQHLLPSVIAGSSMGAIVAGGICSRDPSELEVLFQQPESIHREAFRWRRAGEAWRRRHLMDPQQLLAHIRSNVGRISFREAAEHSGRSLNISVSPTRTRQKPRLLNDLASPEVMIDSALLASCAVPGIYPPVRLRARDGDGDKPYMATEKWIDGSVHGDLPLMRMARLQNVNRTIVSQANPHVLPFIHHHQSQGSGAGVRRVAATVMGAQVATTLKLTRSGWNDAPLLGPILNQAHAMTTQPYLGDINIQFPVKARYYRRVLANPSLEDLQWYIRLGEKATWPKIAMIRDQTRISRIFADCIARLRARAVSEAGSGDAATAGGGGL